MQLPDLPGRSTYNADIFGGKPIIRGRRRAVEHVLGRLASGDAAEEILDAYPWLEKEDLLACRLYAHRLVSQERNEPLMLTAAPTLAPTLAEFRQELETA